MFDDLTSTWRARLRWYRRAAAGVVAVAFIALVASLSPPPPPAPVKLKDARFFTPGSYASRGESAPVVRTRQS